MSMIESGAMAPDFELLNQNGDKVKLSSFKGEKNVVVYFYPKASTPGCTTQACGIRDSKQAFADVNTVVLGLSPDPVDKIAKFVDKQDLNFNLLSDEGHKVADQYGVWQLKKFMGKEYMGIVRSTFIVNKQGYISHVFQKVKTKSHHDDVLSIINTL